MRCYFRRLFTENKTKRESAQIMPIHLECFTYTWRYFCRLFAENKMKYELMPMRLAFMLFSYFSVVYENSEFCYYIFSHNSFDFLCEDCSMCKSSAIRKMWNTKNLRKQVYTLLSRVIVLCDTWKCGLLSKYIGGLMVREIETETGIPRTTFHCNLTELWFKKKVAACGYHIHWQTRKNKHILKSCNNI